jgi:hypothetical protein
MKKVKRKKETPPLGDGGARKSATDQKRAASIEPPTTAAKPRSRKAMTLQRAVQAQDGVTVRPGSNTSRFMRTPSELGVSRQKDEPLTDEEELQQAFNQLVKEGVLVDSGRRRPDRNGRMCIIYVHRNFMN